MSTEGEAGLNLHDASGTLRGPWPSALTARQVLDFSEQRGKSGRRSMPDAMEP